jgi:hypothetical protein
MSNAKPERYGWRGTLGLYEGALRLVGGANATGAIATGVAYHSFSANVSVQGTIKFAGVLFLLGILSFAFAYESRCRKSAQDDKWSFCLTAGTLCLRIRRDHEQTTAPEPHTGLQGESGTCRHQGRSNAC